MNNDKIELSNMGLGDMTISALKAVSAVCPGASAIASLVSDYQNHKQVKLIEDVLNRFFRMIKELDNRVKDLEYMNSHNFTYDLLQTVNYAKDEQDEFRRDMYAKFLTSCCRIENSKDRNKRIFLDYMSKLDQIDSFILKSLSTHYIDQNAIDDVISKYRYEYKIELSPSEVLIHFYYLTSLSIIEMPDQEEVDKFRTSHGEKPTRRAYKKERIYQRTILGDKLYKFIEKAVESEHKHN